MKCATHPDYSGQRKSRTGCADCAKVYEETHKETKTVAVSTKGSKKINEDKPVGKPKKVKEEKPVEEAKKPEVFVEPEIRPVSGHPTRGTYLAVNDYRKAVVKMFGKWFPQYQVRTNSDASIVELEDRSLERALWFNVWSRNLLDPYKQKGRGEILKEAKIREKLVVPGDVFFVEDLQTIVVIISFNPKDQKVFLREWHTQELITMKVKDFEAAKPRELIFKEDMIETKQQIKVLTI